MTLIALQIPDTPGERRLWLEQQVLGLELNALVAQLSAVHGPPAQPQTLDQVLGRSRQTVLEMGLSVLSPEQVRQLLIQPQLLLDLQERVLLEGKSYWKQNVPMTEGMEDAVKRLRFRVQGAIRLRQADRATAGAARYRAGFITQALRIIAVAAVVLLGLGLWQVMEKQVSVTVAWGWLKPQATADDVDAKHYFTRAADLGNEWFNERPQTAEQVAGRLGQLQQGCTRLILAPKQSLSEPQAKWLTGLCQKWADKLRQQMARLENHEDPLKVRDAVDGIMRKAVETLRRGPTV